LGILSLDTKFPRIHGDIGNAETWPFPVLYKIVEGASPDMVVRKGARGLKEYFMQAAKDLVSMGADGIGTTCGFLSLFQDDIAAAAGVPVASSSLMQIPWVQSTLPPGKRVGVITLPPFPTRLFLYLDELTNKLHIVYACIFFCTRNYSLC
ncbi:hypothetical protein OA381_03030, partial [Rhodospirillaceae bacterium]|nr:hypothetical protein [Rhodospirillaceae bacterium]